MNALTEFSHSLRFIATATRYPLKMGAIWPSSPELAKAMADQVDPQIKGPIIELGSGTGSITHALIGGGIDESRLILIENHPDFYDEPLNSENMYKVYQIADEYDIPVLLHGSIINIHPANIVNMVTECGITYIQLGNMDNIKGVVL